MTEANAKLIPQYVSARSPQGLRRAMIMLNAKSGAWHKFFDIQYVDGRWFAWFYQEVTAEDLKPLPVNGGSNG